MRCRSNNDELTLLFDFKSISPDRLKVANAQLESDYILKVTYPDYPSDPLYSTTTKLIILGKFIL